MNKKIFVLLFFLVASIVVISICYAQEEIPTIEENLYLDLEENALEEWIEIPSDRGCQGELPPSNLYSCSMSSHTYTYKRVIYSGCLCYYRSGNTLYAAFKLTSHPNLRAKAVIRVKPFGAVVAQGPEVTNGYSYTSYTNPNIWNYIATWDAPYQGGK